MSIATIPEIIKVKSEYMDRLKKSSIKVVLTPYQAVRRDVWAENIFGNPEYSFMFDTLVPNIEDAIENGYFIAN